MIGRALILSLTVIVFAAACFAQGEPGAAPSPTPPVKRRTFDQFDLSTGIGTRTAAAAAPTVVEIVDERTFEGIQRMVTYAAQIEAEYRSSEGVVIDPSDHFEPNRVLMRKLPALFRIMEMYRTGLLDQPVLKNASNVALLNQNADVIGHLMVIVNSSDVQIARNQQKAVALAERYGAPTYRVEKRPLLNAMFARLNGNFTTLKAQIAVKK